MLDHAVRLSQSLWRGDNMKLKRSLAVGSLVAAAVITWAGWPVYGFFAHNGSVPLPPYGWLELPDNAPAVQQLYEPDFEGAGDTALSIISKHREEIGAPSISAAVSISGRIVWSGAAGWADIETERPTTPQTVFRIGSTSKALTGTALARMVDQDLIDLDTPISGYIADLPNSAWSSITTRQLASHMTGVPDYIDNRDWIGLYRTITLRAHYNDPVDALEVFDGSPLLSVPGTQFHYSTLNTVLLGAVVSAVAGQSYLDLMRDEVFQAAGMTDTFAAPKRASRGDALATFYYRDGHRYREWRPVDLSHRLPGGGFASTPSDLVRLGAKWLDESFIEESTRNTFWSPQRLSNGEVNYQGYALGWRAGESNIEGFGSVRHANHGGVSRGSQCWLQVFPDYDIAIAFTINMKTTEFRDFARINNELFSAFAEVTAGRK